MSRHAWAHEPGRTRRPAAVVGALTLALIVAACSGGTTAGSPLATVQSAPPAAAGSAGGGTVSVFVDIVECTNVGGSGTASGTIQNDAGTPTAYRIRVAFRDAAGAQVADGSADTATAAPGATVDWAVSVAGLGDADVSCHTLDVTGISGGNPPASSGGGSPPAGSPIAEYPCTLVSQSAVEKLAGNTVEPGDASTDHHDEDGTQWTAAACSWVSYDQGATEVDLEVTKAAGFPSGTVGCPPLPGTSVQAAGLSAPATWAWSDPGTQVTVGTLRVCAPAALIDVRVDGTVGEAGLRSVAEGVASTALAAP